MPPQLKFREGSAPDLPSLSSSTAYDILHNVEMYDYVLLHACKTYMHEFFLHVVWVGVDLWQCGLLGYVCVWV